MLGDLSVKDIIEKDIIGLLGGDKLSDEQKATLYEKMLSTIRDRLFLSVDETLDDAQRDELKKIVDDGDQKKLEEFFGKLKLDLNQMMLAEALNYKIELLAYADMVKRGADLGEIEKQAQNNTQIGE